MSKQQFFYNYTASQHKVHDKFNFGIMIAEIDDNECLADDALEELRAEALKDHPNADSINITAFNRV